MKTLNSQTKPMHTIATLSQQIDDEVLSPTALIEHCLERIERLDGEYRTYISVMRDDAQAAAEQALLRAQQKKRLSPIDGLPIAIKDIAATKGVRTTAGSPILKDYVPDRDARIVTALRNAGAVIIGKNNMHEYAYGVTSDNETYGRVVNPLFPGHLPGGSSGGTAAAVAADLAIAGIGSDTGGSIRIPAACCGLVGLKPTFGVLSTDDCIPQAWSLDHLGPITHTVTDARLLYTSLTAPERSFQHTDTHPKPLNQLKIGIPRSLINLAAPQIQEAFDDVVNSLAACGAVVEFFDYSNWDEAYRSWLVTMLAESANYHQLNLRETPDKLDSGIRTYLAIGSTLTAGEYLNAQRYRKKWCTALEKEMARFDVIVNPTLPSRVPRRGDEQVETGLEDMSVRDALVLYQWTANLTGWPSIALPSRHKLDGIPLSIMMTMKPYQEVQLFSVAAAFEAQQSA